MTIMAGTSTIPEHRSSRDGSEDVPFSQATDSRNQSSNNNNRASWTGLSALIQAATVEFGHLVDTTEFGGPSDASSQVSHHSAADGYASSSDGELLAASPPTRNPPTDNGPLSLPEMLMTLLINPDYSDIITFLPDGKFFAIRQQEFTEQLMPEHFRDIASFDQFLELMNSWGFARMSPENNSNDSGIQVFRHPHFRQGGSKDLRQVVRFDQTEQRAAEDAHHHHHHHNNNNTTGGSSRSIEQSFSEDSTSSATTSKRRLSPSHVTRDAEDQSLKQRAVEDTDHDCTPSSLGSNTTDSDQQHPVRSVARRRSSTEARSYALAVTTAKLNIGGDDEAASNQAAAAAAATEQPPPPRAARRASIPLEEGAVERVTQSIVTDAIESLLFDVSHTRETYMKHEKELSTSAFPGVVPISKQLFSAPGGDGDVEEQHQALQPNGATMPPCKDDSSKENAVSSASTSVPSPAQIEAANALMKQAGKF